MPLLHQLGMRNAKPETSGDYCTGLTITVAALRSSRPIPLLFISTRTVTKRGSVESMLVIRPSSFFAGPAGGVQR